MDNFLTDNVRLSEVNGGYGCGGIGKEAEWPTFLDINQPHFGFCCIANLMVYSFWLWLCQCRAHVDSIFLCENFS